MNDDDEIAQAMAEQRATWPTKRYVMIGPDELERLRAEIERLKHYEADFKKVTIQHCGPKCACVREQREALADSEAEIERLRAALLVYAEDYEGCELARETLGLSPR